MERQFENIAEIKDALRDSQIGFWYIEIDDGKAPRVYMDDTLRAIMGMYDPMTPEESYRFWFERIHEWEKDKIRAVLDEMILGRHAEVRYAWEHPTRGTIYIRCGGKLDTSYKNGLRFRGSHQDVTEIDMTLMEIKRRLTPQEENVPDNGESNSVHSGAAVIRFTQNGVMVPEFLSQGFADMCGMPVEQVWELYRKDAMMGVFPDDKEKLAMELNRFLSGNNDCVELVYRLKRGGQGYFWVRNSLTIMHDEKGTKRLYCIYRDITHELEAQLQLRRQYDERLAQHYRTVGPGVLMTGYCNVTQDRVFEIVIHADLGLKLDIDRGRNEFFKEIGSFLTDDEERTSFLNTFLNESALKAYSVGKTEIRKSVFIKFPHDAYGRYVQFKVSMVTAPDTGEVTGILTVTDVTEQNVTKKLFERLSVLGCDLISDVDLHHDCQTFLTVGGTEDTQGKIVSFSSYNENALKNYVVPEDRERLAEILEPQYILNRLEKDGAFSLAYSVEGENGKRLTKHLTISPIDLRLGRVCAARRDITESTEEEQRRKKELEEALIIAERADRAKSDFLSSMSHDIRTPMNAIMGMTTLAQANLDDRARLEDCLKKIALSSEHLLSLINDILDMNKIEQSKLVLNRERIVLAEVLEQMNSMFTVQAEMRKLKFEVRQKCNAGLAFYGDSLRLNQILINLLGNAVKFTPYGGCVELSAEVLTPQSTEGRVKCRFTVRDNGIGMHQDFLEHIFEPFSRGEEAVRKEGSGLGLSITKGIVDLMGGTISVESHINQGSTFTVDIEFEAAEAEKQDKSPDNTPGKEIPTGMALAGYRLLAAEDNELNAEILVELLQMQGANVEVLENGAKLLEVFRNTAPGTYDAVLLDVQMPVMNGYETARALRALDRTDAKTIPILAMTANAFSEDVQAALDAGMDAHVSKPINIDRVVRILRKTKMRDVL